MADRLTRRRFLTDVLFVGGGIVAATLLASGVDGKPAATPTPTPTPTPRQHPAPGKVAAPPPTPRPPGGAVAPPESGKR